MPSYTADIGSGRRVAPPHPALDIPLLTGSVRLFMLFAYIMICAHNTDFNEAKDLGEIRIRLMLEITIESKGRNVNN